jgi:hypothetical protein
VEQSSVVIDLNRQQVRFRVAEGATFDLQQLEMVFSDMGWKVRVLSGPGGPAAGGG